MPTTYFPPATRRPGLWPRLTLFLLVMGFAFQSTRALWEPDEGRYTAVALQMLDSGDLLFPRLNDDQPHLTKPPLTYWAIAGSMALFGRTVWAVRAPYALGFALTGLLVYALALRFVPERPWLPVLLWGTSLLPLLAANVVNTDTLLTLFETLAVFGFVASLATDARAGGLLLMWSAFAFGFMTKGPPALLPLLPIVAWTWAREGRSAIGRLFPWYGLLVFAGLGTTWFAWLFARQPELTGYFFGYELIDRIFSSVHRRNPEWYGALKIYLPVLLLCVLPWLFMTRRWPRALVDSLRASAWRRRLAHDPEGAFLALWLLLPLLVFFFARSRLFLYVLPLAVPIVLLVGRELSRSFVGPLPHRWRHGLIAWGLIALAIKGAVMHLPSKKDVQAQAQALALSGRLDGVDRIVYVGERPHYGLRFYTGLPVVHFDTVADEAITSGLAGQALCRAAVYSPDALLMTISDAVPTAPDCGGLRLASTGEGTWRVERANALADGDTQASSAMRSVRSPKCIRP